jgi:hypothetical protein
VTLDENRLLKHALFWAVLAAGFWLLISVLQSRVVTVIAMIVWSALLYVIFYRDAQKKGPD